MVSYRIGLPFRGSLLVSALPRSWDKESRVVALGFALATWLISLALWVGFDRSSGAYQFVTSRPWREYNGIGRSFGVDGLSIFLVLLTTRLVPLCLLASWESIGHSRRQYYALFLIREALVLVVFTARDLLLFYVSFEAVLIPRFIRIGVWSTRSRKIRAAYYFFLYTLIGSVLRLLALLLLYFETGSRDINLLRCTPLSEARQQILWLAFFISFAVKVPRIPVHIWLPEAHVEAPTAGSVILAGILLKLGTYGLVRFSLPLFPAGTARFTPLVYRLAVLAVVYASLTAIRQSDRKRVIAYSSVAHRNLTLLGLFSLTVPGLEGAVFQRLAHGIISGALFLVVGVLYDRHHTRLIAYYGGVAHTRPIYAGLFLLFTRANIALPGTANFVGEFLILVGIFGDNPRAAFLGASGRILGGAYSLWLLNRIIYGNVGLVGFSSDVNRREFMTFVPLAILAILLGVLPQIFIDTRHCSCSNILEHVRLRELG